MKPLTCLLLCFIQAQGSGELTYGVDYCDHVPTLKGEALIGWSLLNQANEESIKVYVKHAQVHSAMGKAYCVLSANSLRMKGLVR